MMYYLICSSLLTEAYLEPKSTESDHTQSLNLSYEETEALRCSTA